MNAKSWMLQFRRPGAAALQAQHDRCATDRETRRHLGPNPAEQRTDFDRLAQAGAARRGVPVPLTPDQAAAVARTLLARHGREGVTLIRAALDCLPVEPDDLRRAGL